MDNSTENVTLMAGFAHDLLSAYKEYESGLAKDLFTLGKELPSDPTSLIPIQKYNEMCDWIEKKLGAANLKRAGRTIGERVYSIIKQYGMIDDSATPNKCLKALKIVADQAIQDPKKRGWEILVNEDKRVVMRRTQTFNSILQEGLLAGLVEKAGGGLSKVVLLKSIANKDEFDEYEVTWK
ncbi:hypothetical protein EHQ96_07800 [Leptospira levettii]|uniref:hypothetical protein n=1 Tax=Leptospira levettii TaxID=2023178 RepID=UPI001083CDBF|nr:hypothetical protein [Leptospira levettii]TGM69428.1 hypothetical protein EHQ96_07800 [Leptospira levettii]